MHLFVGNISKNVKMSDLEAEFQKFGPCKINVPKVPCPSSSLSVDSPPPHSLSKHCALWRKS